MIKPIAIAALLAFQTKAPAQSADQPQTQHARSEFRISVNLPYSSAFPFFGAWAEQQWAPDWKPEFLYPNPPADKEGAVFRVNHGARSSVWMMTRFDPANGHIQYAFLMNNLVMTRIDIDVKRKGADKTDVTVAYEWTALSPIGDDHVRALARQHEHAGTEWEQQINAYAAEHGGGHKGP